MARGGKKMLKKNVYVWELADGGGGGSGGFVWMDDVLSGGC